MAHGESKSHVVARLLRPIGNSPAGQLRVELRGSRLLDDPSRVELVRAATKVEAAGPTILPTMTDEEEN